MLGPVGVWSSGGWHSPTSGVVRAVLAMLALAEGRSVTQDQLIEIVWSRRSVGSASPALTVAIHRLRKWLNKTAGPQASVEWTSSGYSLNMPGGTDVAAFRRLVADAETMDQAARVDALAEANALWRGPAMADIPADCADESALTRLERERIDAVRGYAHALLMVDRPAEAASLLLPEVERYPLDEPVHSVLIEALAEAGRQAEAFEVYERVRSSLADKLGVDPGRQLREAHLRILRQQTVTATGWQPDGLPPRPVPAQLPAGVLPFIGRERQLRELDRMSAAGEQGAMPILAVVGKAGIGKTALVTHFCHRLRSRFFDGQLYVNLRGYDGGPALRPIEALARFLRAMGVPAERVPIDVDEAAGMYRSLLADRHVLVVLDNANGSEQVRSLLPGSPGCLALVTSRDRLTGLASVAGAHRVMLDSLEAAEAVDLLAQMLGPDRVQGQPDDIVDLAEACANLPLALRVAAAQLADQPHRRISEYVAELRGSSRTALDLSYGELGQQERHLFKLAGSTPHVDLSVEAAAALAGVPMETAERLLRELADAQMVIVTAAGRYGLHDLIRAFAQSLGPLPLDGLLEHYLSAATLAAKSFNQHWPMVRSASGLLEPAEAAAWLAAECDNLLSCFRSGLVSPMWTWQMADTLFFYLFKSGRMSDLLTTHCHGLAAARALKDSHAKAVLLNQLGIVRHHLGQYDLALNHYRHARRAWEQLGEAQQVARAWDNIGLTLELQGRFTDALTSFDNALELLDPVADRHLRGVVLHSKGTVLGRVGRYAEELEYQREALLIAEQDADRWNEARRNCGIAKALTSLSRYDEALPHHHRALEIVQQLEDRSQEAPMYYFLAVTLWQAGRQQEAHEVLERGLELARSTEHRHGQALIERLLATIVRPTDPARAVMHERRAKELFAILRVPKDLVAG